jgi:acyl carrier protein
MTSTFEGLRDIIVKDFELPAERLKPETLLEDIEIDSLAVTELIFALEDRFDVTATEPGPEFSTLGEIADYIDELIAARSASQESGARAAKKAADLE